MAASATAPHLADWALSHGWDALTTSEVAELLGVPAGQVRVRLRAPSRRGEWISPAKGLWVPVPSQHRGQGGPPAIEYIAAWMRHLEARYYVGWLSAAAIHGAAHHAPQVFQVACSKTVADRRIGRSRVEFYRRSFVTLVPVVPRRVAAGDVPVSSRETTALDVTAEPDRAAGIDNAANVIIELAENDGLDIARLAETSRLYPAAAARRVGWILAQHSDVTDLDRLRAVATDRSPTPSLLSPHHPRRGRIDPNWNICLNTDLEPDV
jgi:predicted transcriptional regulator of viral defense system